MTPGADNLNLRIRVTIFALRWASDLDTRDSRLKPHVRQFERYDVHVMSVMLNVKIRKSMPLR